MLNDIVVIFSDVTHFIAVDTNFLLTIICNSQKYCEFQHIAAVEQQKYVIVLISSCFYFNTDLNKQMNVI